MRRFIVDMLLLWLVVNYCYELRRESTGNSGVEK